MAALAAEFVQVCKNAAVNLDFQPRTLPLVDKYLAAARPEAQQRAKAVAAYVGEVIRRETGGLWYEHEGNPALDLGEHQIDPVAFVTLLLDKGSASSATSRSPAPSSIASGSAGFSGNGSMAPCSAPMSRWPHFGPR